MSFTPQTGQRVKVRENHGNSFAGRTATIAQTGYGNVVDSDDPLITLKFDNPPTPAERGSVSENGGVWHPKSLVLLSSESVRIPFSLTTESALNYADHANSRILPPQAQQVLKTASLGGEVDLREFQKALVQAMSGAATRYGQSPMRRALTRQIRHLSYIADAVLDKVLAEGLPLADKVMVDQHVTAKLEDAIRQIDANVEEIERLRIENTRITDSVRAEHENGRRFAEQVKAVGAQRDSYAHELARANERVEAFRSRNTALVRVTEYARSLLPILDRAKVEGFIEGAQAN